MEVELKNDEFVDVEYNAMPTYVSGDRKERESFLSLLGNFSTEERSVFHLLCEQWDHEIGYAKFVTTCNKNQSIDEKDIKSLMTKLRACGCGILLTKYVRGERGADKIILTDVYSKFFFFYFINNEYQKNYDDISIDFVNDKSFEKYELSFSELSVLPLDLAMLNKNFIKLENNQMNIYIISNGESKPMYVTSNTLQDLLKISVRKVKYYLKSESFIAFIAKLMDTSISKIQSNIEQFDISTWMDLTTKIWESKKIINGKFRNISSSFFRSILILNKYCYSEVEHRDKELENDRKLKEILKSISLKIKEREFVPVSQEEFNDFFLTFEDEVPDVKSKFYEQFVDNKTKIGLTEVIFFGQHYIHQDNLYKVFIDRVAAASAELNYYFTSMFRKCLASDKPDQSLHIGYPFECSVMSKLQSDYPIIYDFIHRKSILAEGIIHFSKKMGHSQGKLHTLLSQYFIEGTSEFKDITGIFNLDVIGIYEKAYAETSVYKRFFILIFGQYHRTLEKFTGQRKIQRSKQKAKSKQRKRSQKIISKSMNSSKGNSYPGQGKSLLKEDKVINKPKNYNKEEIEDAWDSLGSELTKKKRTK